MSLRRIRVHSYPSATGTSRGAILFVHGAFVDSTCWEYAFVPFFLGQGYDCFAVDLSGHGASEGRERLHEFGIDDYADDVAHALKIIGRPAIVVGHSMGSLVLQRYLERGDAQAAVFLAPVPATGTAGSAMQLALRHPSFFHSLEQAVQGKVSDEVTDLMARIYFSPGATGSEIQRFLPMVGPESDRAVAEMALLHARPPRRRRRLPALVVGGAEDAVFPASMLFFTALPWQADIYRVPGAGHMFLIDHHWRVAADHILRWIDARATVEAA